MDCTKKTARWDEKHFSLGIWCNLHQRFDGVLNPDVSIQQIVGSDLKFVTIKFIWWLISLAICVIPLNKSQRTPLITGHHLFIKYIDAIMRQAFTWYNINQVNNL